MSIATISPSSLAQRRQKGESCDLIDVRTPVEFREVHVNSPEMCRSISSIRMPIMRARNGNSGEPLYVVCQLGGRSQKACEAFHKKGYTNVVNVEGGTEACVAAGLAARSWQEGDLARTPSSNRRRLPYVLTGVILGWQVHPAFYGLSGFHRRRPVVCRNQQHLRHGNAAHEDAVEQVMIVANILLASERNVDLSNTARSGLDFFSATKFADRSTGGQRALERTRWPILLAKVCSDELPRTRLWRDEAVPHGVIHKHMRL